jgi:hypothetical protein
MSAAQSAFRVRAIVMRKDVIDRPEPRPSKDNFSRDAIKMVLEHRFGTIKKARLKMDGQEDREVRRVSSRGWINALVACAGVAYPLYLGMCL